MEKQLRELFVYSGQGDVYKSMMRTRQKERQRRLQAARALAERKKLVLDIILISCFVAVGLGIIGGLIYAVI
jgi:hypothetical protein